MVEADFQAEASPVVAEVRAVDSAAVSAVAFPAVAAAVAVAVSPAVVRDKAVVSPVVVFQVADLAAAVGVVSAVVDLEAAEPPVVLAAAVLAAGISEVAMDAVARSRAGLTLLELILSLALSSILLIGVGMAIDVHMRTLDATRTHVEEAELARVILRHIADDLQAAIVYEPFDDSGTEGLPEGGLEGAMAGAMGLDANMVNELTGSADSQSSTGTGDETNAETETDGTISGTVEPPPVPGLYGSMYELQVDVSRLPRVDQYQPMLAASDANPVNIPSDVKTVAYFVAGGINGSLAGMNMFTTAATGMYRREVDRAVTQWAAESGALDQLNLGAELLAPEVVGIEFQYFDGAQWWPEWDSDIMGSLPVAVQITLAMQPIGRDDPRGSNGMAGILTTGDATVASEILYYQLVVNLPTAKPAEQVTNEMEALGL